MNYKESLWDQLDLIANKSNERRLVFGEFTSLMIERANIEENYAKSIEKLAKSIQKIAVDSEAISSLFNGVRQYFQDKVDYSRILFKEIRDHTSKLKDFHQIQNVTSRNLIDDGRKLEKEIRQRQQDLDKVSNINEYHSSQSIIQRKDKRQKKQKSRLIQYQINQKFLLKKSKSKVQGKQFHHLQGGIIDKGISSIRRKISRIDLNFQQLFRLLQRKDGTSLFKKAFVFRILYYHNFNLKSIKEQNNYRGLVYNYLQHKRLIIKIYEQSHNKNLSDKSIIQSQNLQNVNANDDIRLFINKFKTNRLFHQKRKYISLTSFVRNSLRSIKSNTYEQIDRIIKDEPYNSILKCKVLQQDIDKTQTQLINSETVMCQYLVKILDALWIGDGKLTSSDYIEFSQKMQKNVTGRHFWVTAFSQFRVKNKFELSHNGFLSISKMLNLLLDICLDEQDTFTVRKMIVLSFTFFTYGQEEGFIETILQEAIVDDEQQKQRTPRPIQQFKIYLQSTIQNHPIWKNKDFWDSIFFESMYEEIKSQQSYPRTESPEETFEREKNTIFGHLASLSHNMLMFELSKNEVKELTNKYSRIHQLADDLNKSLFNNIENSFLTKQVILICPQLQPDGGNNLQSMRVIQLQLSYNQQIDDNDQKESLRESFFSYGRIFMNYNYQMSVKK